MSAIDAGLLVLLGVGPADDDSIAAKLAAKVAKLRVFNDDAGKMNLSVAQVGGECLVVSQFTLYGDVRGGNRPGFSGAAEPASAERLYEAFMAHLATAGIPVKRGRFGAAMEVELVNDGPVTIWLDSEDLFG